ncbi:MAG TPA: APC family permease [Candidatus Eisenbacteria bacterium]|nr:APC family permease [Candidatus Eisenbacteria bacterium]
MAEPATGSTHTLPRVLGLWDTTCVVVGAIIGVGIFFNPRDVAAISGSYPAAMAAWGIGGVIAMLGAVTFAELGRLRPVAGGQYHVLRDAYGRPPAFLFVFCNLTAVQAGGVAIISIVCAQNLGVALHGGAPGEPWVLGMATVLSWSLVLVNVIGVRSGAGLQNATVVLKLLTLSAVVVLAAATQPGTARPDNTAGGSPMSFASLFAAVTLTLFSYGGGQQSLWMAGEVRDAERTVPRAMLLGVATVVAAYLAANLAYFDLLGFDGVRHAEALASDAISVRSPGLGRRIAAAAVALSAFGVLNAQFLSGPRLTWAMARDGLFFTPFARLSRRFATPVPAILLLGVVSSALTLGLGFARTDLLTTGVVVVDAVFFALTGLALPILMRRDRTSRATWIRVAAVAFSVLQLMAITGSLLQQNVRVVALSGLGWIAAAAITWVLFFARRPAPSSAKPE